MTTKPVKSRIKLWVKALRAGRLKQGRGSLRQVRKDHQMTYCCLGVACLVYKKQTGKGRWTAGTADFDVENSANGGSLPPAVQKWFGLRDTDPIMHKSGGQQLAHMNDSESQTFKEIATAIEKEYLK